MSRTQRSLSALLFVLVTLFIPAAFAAADAVTVSPSTAGTDDLIGATNTSWVFTATTTGAIGAGTVVQFVLPPVVQSQPFGVGAPTVVASSSIILVTSTSTHAIGLSAVNSPSGTVIYGFASTTVLASTTFSVTVGGINNASGQISSMSTLAWNVRVGTTTDPTQPGGSLSQTAFIATSTRSLIRGGGALVSDSNSSIVASSYSANAAASYTFVIKTFTAIPIGGKIGINFPAVYNLQGATTTATQNISNTTTAQIAVGAMATSSGSGVNRVTFTTSNAVVNAGDILTVTVNGLTNPSTAGVYRPFSVFTMKANNGLLDGSFFGFEQSDYNTGAPPPQDTVYIGGLNNLIIQVLKQSGGSTAALSGSDLTSVQVGAGCPDKQYFMGLHWLNASSVASWNNVLDCNYMVGVDPFNKANQSFYGSFLPPAMKSVNLVSSGGVGQTATTTLVFGIPNATTTLTLTGGVAGQQAFIQANSANNQSFSKVYTDATYTTPGFNGSGTGYAAININSGQPWSFNVLGGSLGASSNFTSGGTEYWAPVISPINLTSGSTTNISLGSYAYVQASNALNVSLVDTSNNPITNACVGVARSGGGIFMGPQDMICTPNSGNTYQFKVPSGAITIYINRNGFGAPAQYPVAISGTTNKTITLSAPTSFINVTVQTSGGTVINGAPVMANGSNGFGNAMTGTSGTTKIYVQPGAYSVQGFAPAFGPLTAQTVTVTNSSNPSVTFTVNTGTLKTISGQVTQGGSGVAGISVGVHGTGSTSGGNGTQTDASGNYTLYVPAGTYQVQAWSQSTGALAPQTADVTSSNAAGVNWILSAQGTLQLTIQNSSTISPLFGGAFNPTSGLGSGTNSWTTSGTSQIANITLPAGTYNVQAGSPSLGQFGNSSGIVISAGGTTNVTFDAAVSSTLVTLSGSVKASGVGIASVNVWASRINGQGFFSTQTDSSGNYSLTVPDAQTYHMGVRSLQYIANEGDLDVAVAGNTTQNFTLASAGSTISGKVVDSSGNGIANGWVTAIQTGVSSSTQTGTPTDAGGNYTINVNAASTWSLSAQGPCYPRSAAVAASAGDSSKNITLTAQNGCSAPTPQVNAITDSSGGQVSNSNMTLNIPASALGTSQSSVNVSVTSAATVVSSANATPLAASVKDITATNSSGQSITSLNNTASLVITYDPSQLPVGFSESKLQMGYFDNTTGQWEPVAATVNTTNHTLTAQISHFTEYGPILPGVPDAPTALSASAASASQINLSWIASPTATTYVIYRSSTNSGFSTSIATGVSGTSYSDTGLSAGTQYYYEIAGVNSSGEGSNTSSVNATTNAAATGGGGGGGGAPVGLMTQNAAPTIVLQTSTTASASAPGAASSDVRTVAMNAPAPVSAMFRFTLRPGSKGSDVARLQALLSVEQTGYFGALTRAAIEAFQGKYNIASKGDAGFGVFGPKTRTKIMEVFGASAAPSSLSTQRQSLIGSSSAPAAASLTRSLKKGSLGNDVKLLQIILNSDTATQVAVTGEGSPGSEGTTFGKMTLNAVIKFQLKYGIAKKGDSFLGTVGPKTRAKVNGLLAAWLTASATQTNSSTATTWASTITVTSTTASSTIGATSTQGVVSSTATNATSTATSTAVH